MRIIPETHKTPKGEKKGIKKINKPFLIREKQEKKESSLADKPLQLDLGFKNSPLNKLFEVRQKLDKVEDRMRLSHYWRNPMIWITLIFPGIMLALILKKYFEIQSSIPDLVPLVNTNSDLSDLFLPKIWILLIPFLILLCSIITSLLYRLAYRKLEKYIIINMLFFIALSIIGYIIITRSISIFM